MFLGERAAGAGAQPAEGPGGEGARDGGGGARGAGGGAPPSRGLRRGGVGAVLPGWRRRAVGPEPGLPARRSPAARRPRPAGFPAKVSGAARAARARDWGAAGEGARGSRGWPGPSPWRRTVKEQKGAGSAVTWVRSAPGLPGTRGLGPEGEPRLKGPLSCLLLGRRGKEWAGGWGTGHSQGSGNRQLCRCRSWSFGGQRES